MLNRLSLFFILIFPVLSIRCFSKCPGKFINPITDICWKCIFPLKVAGFNVTPNHKEFEKNTKRFCSCSGIPPKIGIPIIFWEPTRFVDVTRYPYCLVGLGGISIGNSIRKRSTVGKVGVNKHSKYHVHWYIYPVLALLELLTDFICTSKGKLDVGYMTEFDPAWNDDAWAVLLDPEASLFANPLAQLSCISDCSMSSIQEPSNKLFWCAGCHGSLYPFSGNVGHHIGAIQASSLLVSRIIAKFHRLSMLKGFDLEEFCKPQYMPIFKKTIYKTQLVFPKSQTKTECNALGRSDAIWGSGKSFPSGGEDFVYLVWQLRHCCLDMVQPALGIVK